MQRFEYRSPRFSADIPVQFIFEESALFGRCIEISEEGMTLQLQEPFPAVPSGVLSIMHRNCTLQLKARVAHTNGAQGGLQFVYESPAERHSVAKIVAYLASAQNGPGPALIR